MKAIIRLHGLFCFSILTGEAMQSTNPCETDCFCGMGEKICAHIDCVPCKGTIIHDGSCCGICQQGCNVEGVFYEIGMCFSLAHWRHETPKWVSGKQCRPRSDAAERGV